MRQNSAGRRITKRGEGRKRTGKVIALLFSEIKLIKPDYLGGCKKNFNTADVTGQLFQLHADDDDDADDDEDDGRVKGTGRKKERRKLSLRILLIRLGGPRTDRFKADVNGLITVRRQVLKSPCALACFRRRPSIFIPKFFRFPIRRVISFLASHLHPLALNFPSQVPPLLNRDEQLPLSPETTHFDEITFLASCFSPLSFRGVVSWRFYSALKTSNEKREIGTVMIFCFGLVVGKAGR